MAREKLEREEHLSELERKEMDWVEYLKENRNKPLSEKLLKLKVSRSKNKLCKVNMFKWALDHI